MLIMKRSKSLGFTLVELMIALTINAILFTALTSIFVANLVHYQRVLNTNRLNQQLETVMALMTDDIRRAGYWSNAANDVGTNQNNNPFMTASTDIFTPPSKSCILFTYDHAGNGTLPAISSGIDDDRYGYRLINNAIQARPPGAAFDCSTSGWENITDTNLVNITSLVFTLNTNTVTTGPGAQGVTLRSVDISITGQLTTDATVTNTLTQHVKVQNDKFIP